MSRFSVLRSLHCAGWPDRAGGRSEQPDCGRHGVRRAVRLPAGRVHHILRHTRPSLGTGYH